MYNIAKFSVVILRNDHFKSPDLNDFLGTNLYWYKTVRN